MFHPPFLQSMRDYFKSSPFWRSIILFTSPNPYFVTFPMLQRRLVGVFQRIDRQKLTNNVDIRQIETNDALICVFVFHPATNNSNNSRFVLLASPNACTISIPWSNRYRGILLFFARSASLLLHKPRLLCRNLRLSRMWRFYRSRNS